MVVKLPQALEIKTYFALHSASEEHRRGSTALNNLNNLYIFTSMYFWSSETGASTRLWVGPEMPAFAMTTSRALIICVFNVSMAVAIDFVDNISSLIINRLDPKALGRADKDLNLDRSRTVAIIMVFGVDRYVATSSLPSLVKMMSRAQERGAKVHTMISTHNQDRGGHI
jgi:hypothetical protein